MCCRRQLAVGMPRVRRDVQPWHVQPARTQCEQGGANRVQRVYGCGAARKLGRALSLDVDLNQGLAMRTAGSRPRISSFRFASSLHVGRTFN
jgi:hypothetical protein